MQKAVDIHNGMLGRSSSLPLWNSLRVTVKAGRRRPFGFDGQRSASIAVAMAVAGNGSNSRLRVMGFPSPNWNQSPSTVSVSVTAPPPIQVVLKPSPQLGLLSLLFVLSMALGSIFILAIISIPTMNAFTRLAASMNKLSKVVSEEVPGTLSSLKLSGFEINDLTQQLTNLRQRISGTQYQNKVRHK